MIFLGWASLYPSYLGLCASWTCMSNSLTKLGKFSFIIFSNRFPNFLLFLFSFWHPYDANVGHLEVVPEAAYTILLFLDSFFRFFGLLFLKLSPFKISYNNGLVMMNSFSFFLVWEALYLPFHSKW